MTSSSKKKKEKKKDFQKVKLKVGKGRPKAANSTDTSFKAKSIALKQQSLSTVAPTLEAQCAHHLGLLNHKSDAQRRESLAYLTTAIVNNPPMAPLPQPASVIIPVAQRLILDGTNSVRQQLLKLLHSLPPADIASHADQLLLHTRAAMTHLANEIRTFGLDVLDWLLGVAGDEVVSCAGGWVKMLKCFLSLLGWQSEATSKWSAPKAFGKADSKMQARQMSALTTFLRTGLFHAQAATPVVVVGNSFPLWQTEHHRLSERSNAYAHLNLFGATRDEEAEMYEDREDRQRIFHDRAETAVVAGLEQATKAGGELGRAAAQLRKVVKDGMADFYREEVMVP
ncbi:pre-rRNA-processing protein IPI1 [Parastagonospora nodorum]|uniref:Pre-rRNA-processing protein n=1 Tax=Phaeosphaeria nodorum (strain SN15 / ATCC MYA-4574 / FGSC 10173) TaxID=321614 RepID=A0A7U2HXU3_PHANO|nr:pre-rRNA-processing protein IPI1 [Parastagonospora nodorum]QRC94349.1 pre-rRNA-processing protein IPI1 [Parastagonospora nodorum SN15]KAH3928623.1 pre-rRNA-processing protein IPI1 [Parastagonospora nodorum]KAH3945342.1 pre-rRNA-processing protein IPI1 [Parastagonospora nodorum]KAH3983662.1 pre-rRNA-processing protein IPI1 [Parastagonospora nodorum]